MSLRSIPLVAAMLLAPAARAAHAQNVSPTGTLGIVLPRGVLAERFRPGPVLGGGFAVGLPDDAWQVRFVGEYWHLPPGAFRPRPTSPAPLHVVAGAVALGARATTGRLRPEGVVTLGKAHMHVRGHPNPYGLVWTVSAGVGLRAQLGRRRAVTLETRIQAILSDYAVSEYSFPTAVPIAVRLQL